MSNSWLWNHADTRWWFQTIYIYIYMYLPLRRGMIQFDWRFSNGLKPSPRIYKSVVFSAPSMFPLSWSNRRERFPSRIFCPGFASWTVAWSTSTDNRNVASYTMVWFPSPCELSSWSLLWIMNDEKEVHSTFVLKLWCWLFLKGF